MIAGGTDVCPSELRVGRGGRLGESGSQGRAAMEETFAISLKFARFDALTIMWGSRDEHRDGSQA